MRDERGQFIKGYTGNPHGRPKKADERMLLDIWDQYGRGQFIDAIERGDPWAIKTLVDKIFPNKKEALQYIAFDPTSVDGNFDFKNASDDELNALISEV